MSRLNSRRKYRPIVDTNCEILSLAEAVRRWTESGQFLLTEVNGTDSYESKGSDIPFSAAQQQTIPKIETALAGKDFVREVKAQSQDKNPEGSGSEGSGSEGSGSEGSGSE